MIAICILAIGIVVSGNRMPFILFLFGLFLVFLFSKKLKKIALVSFFDHIYNFRIYNVI